MGALVSGSEIELYEFPTSSGPWETQSVVRYYVPEFLIASEIIGSGKFDWSETDVNIGAAYIAGNGLVGFEGSIAYNPSTGQFKLELGGAQFALGGDVSVTFNFVDGKLIPDVTETSGFVGFNLILGDQGEFLGITAGQAGSLKFGLFLDTDGSLDLGMQASFSQGVIVGSFEGQSRATLDLFKAGEMTIEEFKLVVDEIDPALWDKFQRLDALELLNIFGIRTGVEMLDRWDKNCFLASTPIAMSDGTTKPIEDIQVGDKVLSYDPNGPLDAPLTAQTVTELFRNEVAHILDVHGLVKRLMMRIYLLFVLVFSSTRVAACRMELFCKPLIVLFFSTCATLASANSCPPPIETDLLGNMLPTQRTFLFSKLNKMTSSPNNALFSGILVSGSRGSLERRAEYIWIQHHHQEQIDYGFIGNSSVIIFDAYLFTGSLILDGQVVRLEDTPVQFRVSCLVDNSSGCSLPLATDLPITFGGNFFGDPARIVVSGLICEGYLVNSTFQNLVTISDIEKSHEIWMEE